MKDKLKQHLLFSYIHIYYYFLIFLEQSWWSQDSKENKIRFLIADHITFYAEDLVV